MSVFTVSDHTEAVLNRLILSAGNYIMMIRCHSKLKLYNYNFLAALKAAREKLLVPATDFHEILEFLRTESGVTC